MFTFRLQLCAVLDIPDEPKFDESVAVGSKTSSWLPVIGRVEDVQLRLGHQGHQGKMATLFYLLFIS